MELYSVTIEAVSGTRGENDFDRTVFTTEGNTSLGWAICRAVKAIEDFGLEEINNALLLIDDEQGRVFDEGHAMHEAENQLIEAARGFSEKLKAWRGGELEAWRGELEAWRGEYYK